MAGNKGLFFDGRTTSPSYAKSTTFGTTPTYTENTTIGTTSEAEHLWTILGVFLGLVVFIIISIFKQSSQTKQNIIRDITGIKFLPDLRLNMAFLSTCLYVHL